MSMIRRIWIEARWWWYRRDTLRGILGALRPKISENAESHTPYALIFTVDSVKEKSWTPGKAEKWLASEARKDEWTLDCAVPVRSNYFGATDTDTTEKHRKGLFVAAFFRLPDQYGKSSPPYSSSKLRAAPYCGPHPNPDARSHALTERRVSCPTGRFATPEICSIFHPGPVAARVMDTVARSGASTR